MFSHTIRATAPLLLYVAGTFAGELFVLRVSALASIAAVVVTLAGTAQLRMLAAPLLLLLSTPLAAQSTPPIGTDDLARHIRVLASDEYQGRMPGTEGEVLTTRYIVEQFQARGLEPAGANGGWFQPVPLVERSPGRHQVRWSANGRSSVQAPPSRSRRSRTRTRWPARAR